LFHHVKDLTFFVDDKQTLVLTLHVVALNILGLADSPNNERYIIIYGIATEL